MGDALQFAAGLAIPFALAAIIVAVARSLELSNAARLGLGVATVIILLTTVVALWTDARAFALGLAAAVVLAMLVAGLFVITRES